MIKLPSCSYKDVIRAFKRDGWVVIRQRGSHIRMLKLTGGIVRHIYVPAHSNIMKGTLHAIISDAGISEERFIELLK